MNAVVDETDQPASAAPPAVEIDLQHQVRLDGFSGPLDLLLYLVRRTEVDIAEIPVAEIADQYIAAVASWSELDLESAGDFILMAATLLELKSRLVAPPPEVPEGEEGAKEDEDGLELLDPRANLIRQLLTYRRFKEATRWLHDLEAAQAERSPRQLREDIPDDPDELEGMALENCDAGALWSIWESVLIRINGLGPRTVVNDDVPLETRIVALADQVRAQREARLSALLVSEPSKVGRVGILLATLECARQRLLEATQLEQYGEVFLRWRDSAPPVEAPPAEPEEPGRRRRRPPLVTWHAGAATEVPDADEAETPEELVESDEQRFLRELEEACAVESVTARVADLEGSFAAFVQARAAAREAPLAPASSGPAAPTPPAPGALPA